MHAVLFNVYNCLNFAHDIILLFIIVIKADRINRFKLHGAVTDSMDCYICTRSFLTGFTKFLR